MRKLSFDAAIVALAFPAAANAMQFSSPVAVRSGPGTAWRVIARIPAGADVQILSCASGWRHFWCDVQYGAVRGYIHATAIAPTGPGKAPLAIAPVVTTDPTNMRTSPSLFSHVEQVIPGGAPVNVLKCASGLGRGWCKIAYNDMTGYVRGGLLARNVP